MTTRRPGSVGRASARAGIAAVVIWALVVLAGSTAVWAVISRAGREVAGVAEPRGAKLPGHHISPRVLDSTSPLRAERSGKGGRSHDGGGPGSGDSSGGTGPSGTSDGSDGSGGDDGGEPSGGHSSSNPPPGPDPVRDTSDGQGGSVTIECTGPVITDYTVTPDDGWAAHFDYEAGRTAAHVELQPQGGSGEDVEVKAWCQGGAPHFQREGGGGEQEDDAAGADDGLRARSDD